MAYKKAWKKGAETSQSSSDKYSDYVQGFNDKVIAAIEENNAPWQRPWNPGETGAGGGLPYNAMTGKAYSGSNSLYLSMEQAMRGYTDDRWLTFKQGGDLGAHVRKGEKGTQLAKWLDVTEKKEENNAGQNDDASTKRLIPMLFTVFNASQFEGLPPAPERPQISEQDRHEKCDQLIKDSGANIQENGGDRAFYRPGSDSIHLPHREQFKSPDAYYATTLHELGHWSGHQSRLARDLTGGFGSECYAKEELRAEISSMMMGQRLQIGHDPSQHAAYVGHWLNIIKTDPKAILNACRDAEKICEFLGVEKYEHQATVALEKTNEATAENAAAIVSRIESKAFKPESTKSFEGEWVPDTPSPMARPLLVIEKSRARGMSMGM